MPSYPRIAAGVIATACLIPAILPAGSAQDAGGYSEEVKKRLGQWPANPVLAPYTAGLPTPTPPPGPGLPPAGGGGGGSGGARNKISIHFGLNEVDPAFYGSPCRLGACVNDAKAMEQLARRLGFQTNIKLNQDATSATLFALLKDAAQKLGKGDILIVTYAGHGSQVKDLNGDEQTGQDQTWCLFNRMVIDDELGEAWTQFREGVKIYVVADSCHSGTSTRALARGKNLGTSSLGALALAGREVPSDFKVRTLMLGDQQRAEAIQMAAFGNTWRAVPPSEQSERAMQAAGLLLAGCDDNETSGERGQHGLFTNGLLLTIGDGRFDGTYRDLIEQASRKIGDANQHPKLFQFGVIVEDTAKDRPFAH